MILLFKGAIPNRLGNNLRRRREEERELSAGGWSAIGAIHLPALPFALFTDTSDECLTASDDFP